MVNDKRLAVHRYAMRIAPRAFLRLAHKPLPAQKLLARLLVHGFAESYPAFRLKLVGTVQTRCFPVFSGLNIRTHFGRHHNNQWV